MNEKQFYEFISNTVEEFNDLLCNTTLYRFTEGGEVAGAYITAHYNSPVLGNCAMNEALYLTEGLTEENLQEQLGTISIKISQWLQDHQNGVFDHLKEESDVPIR